MSNLGKSHWDAVKWMFKYLRDTSRACLCLEVLNKFLKVFQMIKRDLGGRKFASHSE